MVITCFKPTLRDSFLPDRKRFPLGLLKKSSTGLMLGSTKDEFERIQQEERPELNQTGRNGAYE